MPNPPRYAALLVDDDPAALLSLEAVLSLDFDVSVAHSGSEALALLTDLDVHIVCADYRMPGMNGFELLARVEKLRRGIACLLITGLTDVLSRESWLEHPYIAVLYKPYEPDVAIRLIRRFCRMSERRRKRRGRGDVL